MGPSEITKVLQAVDRLTAVLTAHLGVPFEEDVLPLHNRGPQLLTNSAAARAGLEAAKPHFKVPTWKFMARDMTCVWPLLGSPRPPRPVPHRRPAHYEQP